MLSESAGGKVNSRERGGRRGRGVRRRELVVSWVFVSGSTSREKGIGLMYYDSNY